MLCTGDMELYSSRNDFSREWYTCLRAKKKTSTKSCTDYKAVVWKTCVRFSVNVRGHCRTSNPTIRFSAVSKKILLELNAGQSEPNSQQNCLVFICCWMRCIIFFLLFFFFFSEQMHHRLKPPIFQISPSEAIFISKTRGREFLQGMLHKGLRFVVRTHSCKQGYLCETSIWYKIQRQF